jgi:hypothetical protein
MKRPLGFAPRSVISLRYFQSHHQNALAVHGHKRVRIWSDEHRAYWRPNGNGYVVERAGAGVFTVFEAYNRTAHCGPEKHIWFEWQRDEELIGLAARCEREADNWKGLPMRAGLLDISKKLRELAKVVR